MIDCGARYKEYSIVFIVFSKEKKKSVSLLPREWLIFPGFVFLPIYFSRVTLALVTLFSRLPFLLSSLICCCSRFFFTRSLLSIYFLLCSFPLYSNENMCGKNPALGLHCLFHVRTSGDIKGPQRGLSVCISPALAVCAQDPSMR